MMAHWLNLNKDLIVDRLQHQELFYQVILDCCQPSAFALCQSPADRKLQTSSPAWVKTTILQRRFWRVWTNKNTQSCTRLYWAILGCSGLYQAILGWRTDFLLLSLSQDTIISRKHLVIFQNLISQDVKAEMTYAENLRILWSWDQNKWKHY